jgi:hypothetical protein
VDPRPGEDPECCTGRRPRGGGDLMPDLDQQILEVRDQLTALSRQIRTVTATADEQDRIDVIDGLADVQLHLNDALEAFEAMRER